MFTRWVSCFVALCLGVLTAVTALELVLRALPVTEGQAAAEPDSNWPVNHMTPHSQYTFSTGWDLEDVHHGRINNMGYVAPFDYQPGSSGVFIVGDSFIEDMMNDYSQSIQGALPALLKSPLPVLNFGIAGGQMPNDLGVAALVGERFRPSWAVVVFTRGNFIRGLHPEPGYFRWTPTGPPGIELLPPRRHSKLALFVRSLAIVRYARANLRADPARLLAIHPGGGTPDSGCAAGLSQQDEARVRLMADNLPSEFKLPASRVILVFDADRESIYSPGNPNSETNCPTRDSLARALLAQAAAARGMGIIDMEPTFRAHFQASGEHFDYLPVDAHWNGTAHKLAAAEVARYINLH
jgi:hypothetical protein